MLRLTTFNAVELGFRYGEELHEEIIRCETPEIQQREYERLIAQRKEVPHEFIPKDDWVEINNLDEKWSYRIYKETEYIKILTE